MSSENKENSGTPSANYLDGVRALLALNSLTPNKLYYNNSKESEQAIDNAVQEIRNQPHPPPPRMSFPMFPTPMLTPPTPVVGTPPTSLPMIMNPVNSLPMMANHFSPIHPFIATQPSSPMVIPNNPAGIVGAGAAPSSPSSNGSVNSTSSSTGENPTPPRQRRNRKRAPKNIRKIASGPPPSGGAAAGGQPPVDQNNGRGGPMEVGQQPMLSSSSSNGVGGGETAVATLPFDSPIFEPVKPSVLNDLISSSTNAASTEMLNQLATAPESIPGFKIKRKRASKRAVPEEEKDERYYARRNRNNLAAKRSRDARRKQELDNLEMTKKLDAENAELRKLIEKAQAELAHYKQAQMCRAKLAAAAALAALNNNNNNK